MLQFVVVEPTATLESVADALNAYQDRKTGDTGVVIVAENIGQSLSNNLNPTAAHSVPYLECIISPH